VADDFGRCHWHQEEAQALAHAQGHSHDDDRASKHAQHEAAFACSRPRLDLERFHSWRAAAPRRGLRVRAGSYTEDCRQSDLA